MNSGYEARPSQLDSGDRNSDKLFQERDAAGSRFLFQSRPGTAGVITGKIEFTGRKPQPRIIDMDQDADCARLHNNGRVTDELAAVNAEGRLANVFVYLKSGLEGKKFEPPPDPSPSIRTAAGFSLACWAFRPARSCE
jgi:hypothetical protein